MPLVRWNRSLEYMVIKGIYLKFQQWIRWASIAMSKSRYSYSHVNFHLPPNGQLMVQWMMYLVWGGPFMVPSMDLCIYIMDYEVVPSSLKYMIGRWTRPVITLVYIKEKKCKSGHGTLRSQECLFLGIPCPMLWSNVFCGEREKIGSLTAKVGHKNGPWQKNAISMFI